MQKPYRREVLRRGVGLVSAFAVLPLIAAAAKAAEPACVEHASEPLREGLNYADPSPNAAQACSGCGFFKATTGACGDCQIMTGPVAGTAHCDSWSAKS
jgi:hypothetical protein